MFSQAHKKTKTIKADVYYLQESEMLRMKSRSMGSPCRMTQHAGLLQQLGIMWNHSHTALAKHFNMTQILSYSYKKKKIQN